MDKLKILLTGNKTDNYVKAIEASGGIAVTDDGAADTVLDGLIVCGGSDVDPAYYGEEINGSVNVDRDRDARELELIEAYVKEGKPVFGICRGHQLINVYFGGTLIQDIAEASLHKRTAEDDRLHTVTAEEGSVICDLYGKELITNSSHHQAVNKVGEGLRVTARWQGRVAEAIEHTSLPVLGVQWHPERMCFDYARPDTVDGALIFRHFLSLCADEKRKNKV